MEGYVTLQAKHGKFFLTNAIEFYFIFTVHIMQEMGCWSRPTKGIHNLGNII
jgi:hypothetical protein